MTASDRMAAFLVGLWGIAGFAAALGSAVWRITPPALEPLRSGQMTAWQSTAFAFVVIAVAWSKGYMVFQRRVAPRVVARGLYLAQNRRPLHVLLAPAYCMGLIYSTRKRVIASWLIVVMVVCIVVAVSRFPQPWRGMCDAGAVVGLSWGVVAVLWGGFSACVLGRLPQGSAELPDDARPPNWDS